MTENVSPARSAVIISSSVCPASAVIVSPSVCPASVVIVSPSVCPASVVFPQPHSVREAARMPAALIIPLLIGPYLFLNMDCLAPCICLCFNTSSTASMRSPASMKSQYLQKG